MGETLSKRREAKQRTRAGLIEAAKVEFAERGFLNTATADIAERAGVAHGTLFLHFQTKEKLILEILERVLLELTDELHRLLFGTYDVRELLVRYLDFLEREEPFFTILNRELPFYSMQLRRQVMVREAAVRHYFYDALERGIDEGRYRRVDITAAIGMLFGSLNSYLANRELFIVGESIIAEKRDLIVDTFLKLISAEEERDG
jgi:AcrR family transcriptional regulator